MIRRPKDSAFVLYTLTPEEHREDGATQATIFSALRLVGVLVFTLLGMACVMPGWYSQTKEE